MADMTAGSTLRLGLIGGSIRQSRSPALHIVCGLSVGLNVSYDLIIPAERGQDFATVFAGCAANGFAGVNVTYPFKEEVFRLAAAGKRGVADLGAANTICFTAEGATAWNTDRSGFAAAFEARWPGETPGSVLLIGAGGAGRAIAFALADLGARELMIHDSVPAKASALAADIARTTRVPASGVSHERLADLSGIDGLVNATPLGMEGRGGSPLPSMPSGRPSWAFDAVYTPEHTAFRAQAERLGAEFLSGYELYFHQGIQAFRLFSGTEVTDPAWVRRILAGRTFG
jgi:shikimate dehydrogenase